MQIFYTWKRQNSTQFLNTLLKKYFHIHVYTLERTEYGKKYILLSNGTRPLEFSITHSKNLLAIAFHTTAIGIDSEYIREKIPKSIFKGLTISEQEECKTNCKFFENWTAKESFIKCKGKSILKELKHLSYTKNRLTYNGEEVPYHIYFKELKYQNESYILTVCTQERVCTLHFKEVK